ncbi:MAG: hypothetical protein M3Q45_13200 [Chloroflexota bacterium]|nr:hypothetical protein [Chloroflexota bacterium]
MSSDLLLRRKWTLRAHGRQVVFVKNPHEHTHHVLMKALLWALYLQTYPALQVEIAIGDRYRPDVVALHDTDPRADPHFWGEAGQVGVEKIHTLVRRYRDTHFAIAKWATNLYPWTEIIVKALNGVARNAPFDLICFPENSAEQFIDEHGTIRVRHADLVWRRLG